MMRNKLFVPQNSPFFGLTAFRPLISLIFMKYSYVFVFLALLPSGCSMLINETGFDLSSIPAREDVRICFGNPVQSGTMTDEDGKTNAFDDYIIQQKIAHGEYSMYGMGIAMTLGTCELIMFPWEVMKASQNMLLGSRIRFVYSSEGKVVRIMENDKDYYAPFLPSNLARRFKIASKQYQATTPQEQDVSDGRN